MTEPIGPAESRRGSLLRRWIGTLGGAGLLPIMPGTWGSLLAAIAAYVIYLSASKANFLTPFSWNALLIAGVIGFGVLSVILGRTVVEDFGRKDPGPFVLDEAAGICLTLLFQPMLSGRREGWVILAAFAAFRIFDVWKLPPARQLERLPAGWGILLDDLAAAVYANLLCQLVLRGAYNLT